MAKYPDLNIKELSIEQMQALQDAIKSEMKAKRNEPSEKVVKAIDTIKRTMDDFDQRVLIRELKKTLPIKHRAKRK